MQIETWDRVSFRGGAGWLHGAQECVPAFRRLQKCTAKRAKHYLWEVNFPHLRAAFEPRRRGPFRWRFGSRLALTLNEKWRFHVKYRCIFWFARAIGSEYAFCSLCGSQGA